MSRFKRAALDGLVVSLLLAPAYAHEHWIDVSTYYPDVGDTLAVHVCSGHYYPSSVMGLKNEVFSGLSVRGNGEEHVLVETIREEKERIGSFAVEGTGVYVTSFSLKRPQAKTPSYEAKSLLVVDAEYDDQSQYSLGKGLELIPETSISHLSPGDELPIHLMFEGEPISGSLSVTPADGKTVFLRACTEQPALVPIRNTGRHLITATMKGRGCSLTFMVRGTQ